ncbi:hypothetical protein CC79DRAFT_883508 [Sarocladium strictum]
MMESLPPTRVLNVSKICAHRSVKGGTLQLQRASDATSARAVMLFGSEREDDVTIDVVSPAVCRPPPERPSTAECTRLSTHTQSPSHAALYRLITSYQHKGEVQSLGGIQIATPLLSVGPCGSALPLPFLRLAGKTKFNPMSAPRSCRTKLWHLDQTT